VLSLAKAEAAADRDEGTRQYRILKGYRTLVNWLQMKLRRTDTQMNLNTIVHKIQWAPGEVEVEARTPTGGARFKARQAVVTLPLGVLQNQNEDGVVFDPPLIEKEAAIHGLSMGSVVKMTFQFRSRFWAPDDFGFIHAIGRRFPTWWSDRRGLIITGWAGGPRARELSHESIESIQSEALLTLSEIFKTDSRQIQDLLTGVYHHDWIHDPFSQGAYSYTPVNMIGAAEKLAAPIGQTLFFAGEATDNKGEQGTVHGALESGQRAAKELMEVLNKSGRAVAK
jgi:monoamine oxidase